MNVYVVQVQARRGSDWFVGGVYTTEERAYQELDNMFLQNNALAGYIEKISVDQTLEIL